MSEITRLRISAGMRWIGRIIGFSVFIFSMLIIAGNISLGWSFNIIPFLVITFIALVGIVISWRNQPIASILLFLSTLGLGIRTFYTYQIGMLMIIGSSYLVASILIFSSWWISGKNRH